MTTKISTLSPKVFINAGKAVTTTEEVATYFGKQHHHVVQKLLSLECSEDFTIRNFSRMVRNKSIGSGAEREVIYYEMTKDGFIFLVMGFTGKKAAAFKEAYIAEFNRMERELNKPSREIAKTTTDERTPLRDAINMLVGKKGLVYPEAYSLIHQRFNVSHIDELEQSQLPVAVEYVHRLVLEGELLERDSTSSEPSEREKLAYNVSALATHFEVIYEAWNERILPVLNSMESPLAGRLVSRFTHCDTFMMFVKRSAERQLRKGEVARIL